LQQEPALQKEEGVRVAACGSIVCCVLEANAVTLDGDFTE